jgi:hypothetical protein
MPPKRALPATERVVPYDLRRSHIPRIVPSERDQRPAGDYLPTAAAKRINTMKKRAATRGHPTKLPARVKALRKQGREETLSRQWSQESRCSLLLWLLEMNLFLVIH